MAWGHGESGPRVTRAFRSALAVLLGCGLAASAGAAGSATRWCAARGSADARAAAPRPNVIVVMTDDQRWDSLPHMPATLERLAGEGLHFSNSFVTTPLCGPSRAGFLTGQGLRGHGVIENDVRRFDPSSTIATWLQAAGYTTGIVGKYLNGYQGLAPAVPPGWDRWQVIELPSYYDYRLVDDGELRSFGHEPEDYSTDVVRELALDFIEDHAGGPFFLYVNTWAPHDRAEAAPRHVGRYADLPPLRPVGYHEADMRDKGPWAAFARFLRASLGDAFVQGQNREYQAMRESLLAVDELVEAILDSLLRLGIDRETMVIFTSDNGLMRGEHWFYWKMEPFEPSIRVPLLVRYPPLTDGGGALASRTSGALVVNLDLAPTIAELAGAEAPADMEGRSLAPLLCGDESRWRHSIVLENDIPTDFLGMPLYRALRTHRWKYVRFGLRDGRVREELYRLDRDPAELENVLYTDPDRRQHQRTLERMRKRLNRLVAF